MVIVLVSQSMTQVLAKSGSIDSGSAHHLLRLSVEVPPFSTTPRSHIRPCLGDVRSFLLARRETIAIDYHSEGRKRAAERGHP